MKRLQDYTLDQTGLNWATVLSPWAWLLPSELTVWLVNRLGDIFAVLDGEAVHMMDVGRGTLEEVAPNRDAFAELADQGQNAEGWFAIPLVNDLVATGMTLGAGQCYSYKKLPIIGGSYEVENFRVLPLEQHYRTFGPIHKALKDVPDGTSVRSRTDG